MRAAAARLNIAAARAATHPDTPLDTFADQLRDAHCRLDLLAVGENTADLRAVFSWPFQTLTAQAARMFRLLVCIRVLISASRQRPVSPRSMSVKPAVSSRNSATLTF